MSQILDLRSSNKHANSQNLSIYYIWTNIRQQYKKNKLKIIAPTCNDEFQLHDGSYSASDIHDNIKPIIKKHEALPTNPTIHVYINRVNNGLVFKIKNEYKLEMQMPETMKLLGSTKKSIGKTKNGENVPNFEVVEVVSIQ